MFEWAMGSSLDSGQVFEYLTNRNGQWGQVLTVDRFSNI